MAGTPIVTIAGRLNVAWLAVALFFAGGNVSDATDGPLHIEMRPTSQVRPYEHNPRLNDDAVNAVIASLREFGWRQPIVVDADGVIIAGHTRWKAARRMGLSHVPVHVAGDLTPEQARAYRIADNQSGSISEWDMELLPLELCGLRDDGFDLAKLGFDDRDLARLLDPEAQDGLTEANAVPEPPAEPITQRGDLWLLGQHRLLCGDSTDANQVRLVMDGQLAALFATDPPYLVDYTGNNRPGGNGKDWTDSYGRTWDDADEHSELYDRFIAAAVEAAVLPDAAWYCWHATRRQALLEAAWTKHGAFLHQTIIWMKNRPTLTHSWYLWQYEPCFFGWVRPNKPPRMSEQPMSCVWHHPSPTGMEGIEHPTPKPIELFATPMLQHTKADDVCFEPFAGSGSQIIAAETLARRCYAIEISPVYCDVIVQRWEQFTGRKAERAA